MGHTAVWMRTDGLGHEKPGVPVRQVQGVVHRCPHTRLRSSGCLEGAGTARGATAGILGRERTQASLELRQ